jgi:hypothetical protein
MAPYGVFEKGRMQRQAVAGKQDGVFMAWGVYGSSLKHVTVSVFDPLHRVGSLLLLHGSGRSHEHPMKDGT